MNGVQVPPPHERQDCAGVAGCGEIISQSFLTAKRSKTMRPAVAIASMSFPIGQGCSNAIWQAKVAPDVQGRVFSARRSIAWFVDPISPIIAGTLADLVTEPAMQSGAALSDSFGWLVGTGPGSGMALQYILSGLLWVVIIGIASFIPLIRHVEDLLPDHEQAQKAADTPVDPAGSAIFAQRLANEPL